MISIEIPQPQSKGGFMMTSGIAAHTAFAVFGGSNFFSEYFTGSWSVLLWTMLTVVGVIIIRYYKKTYLKKKQVTI